MAINWPNENIESLLPGMLSPSLSVFLVQCCVDARRKKQEGRERGKRRERTGGRFSVPYGRRIAEKIGPWAEDSTGHVKMAESISSSSKAIEDNISHLNRQAQTSSKGL